MKMIKMALLGGAALAVSSMAAQADDSFKAQLEVLNARMAAVEAAKSVPAGYSLLTIADGQAHVVPGMTAQEQASFAGNATIISVMPTADAPAGTTIEWNGFVRAIIGYSDLEDIGDDLSVVGRGRLNVTAKTDTAVGEVGVRMRLEGNGSFVDTDYGVEMEIAWGWWSMTPELTLGGGYNGSLGNIGFGYDGACTCHWTDNAAVALNPGDATQMRLTYASGPMSAAIAIEDGSGTNGFSSTVADSPLRFAGEIAYAGDSFSGEISGIYATTDGAGLVGLPPVAVDWVDSYQIGAGIGFNMGDMASLSLAAGFGRTKTDDEYMTISGLVSMNLSDAAHAEIGVGYKDADSGEVLGVLAGLYYHPVDQLTIGLEGEYVDTDGLEDFYAGLVTVWSF